MFTLLDKIGRTSNLEKRFAAIQGMNSTKLSIFTFIDTIMPNSLELSLHRLFNKYHVRGEWFNIPSTLIIHDLLKKYKEDNQPIPRSQPQQNIVKKETSAKRDARVFDKVQHKNKRERMEQAAKEWYAKEYPKQVK